jgi:hypothetical protein
VAKNLEEKPPLSVVNLPSSTPKPPANLGPAGAGLWRSIMSEYDVSDAGGQAMLEQAAFAYDRAERGGVGQAWTAASRLVGVRGAFPTSLQARAVEAL